MSRYWEGVQDKAPTNFLQQAFIQTVYKRDRSNFRRFNAFSGHEDATMTHNLHKLSYLVENELGFTVLGSFTVNRALLVSFAVTTFSNIVLFLQTSKDYQMLMEVPQSALSSQVSAI